MLFLVIWIYYSLNARYINFSLFTILRWVFPILLIGMAILQNRGVVIAPPALLWWVTAAVLPSIILGADVAASVAKFISLVLIFYGSYFFFYQLKSIKRMARCLDILAVVLVIFQVLNLVFTVLGVGEINDRAAGITTNANTLGVYSNLAFWAGVYFLGKSRSRAVKTAYIVMMVSTVYTVIASGSRMAFVVLALNVLLVSYLAMGRRRSFGLLVIAVAALGYLLFTGKLEFLGFSAVKRLAEEGGTEREELWEHALDVWRSKPWLGVGYTLSPEFNALEYGLAFHNSYLSFLVECGIWGAAVLGLGMVSLTVKIFKEVKSIGLDTQWGELSIACMMIINLAVTAWSESFLFAVGSTEGFTFWFLLAWVMVYIIQNRTESGAQSF